ncbi:MAG: DUF4388 domain-containing protein [Pseudomonadota bacterium]
MNLQGDFEGLFLTSILQLLCNEQNTGLLRVTSGQNEARVFFKDGTIVYASGSQKEVRLGYILRREGIISAEQLEKCLTIARENNLSLGRILVEKGYVSLKTLEKYNTKQVEEILYNLLLWKQGRFEYRDVKLKLDGMIVTQLNPMKLILEASRRIDEMSVLEKVITSDTMVFAISGNVRNKEEIKLNANEWRILSLIDGARSIRQIVTSSGYDEFAVYKIFFSLISYGVIEEKEKVLLTGPDGDPDLASLITVYHDIFQAIWKHVFTELGDRTASVFKDALSGLDAAHQTILKAYDPGGPVKNNISAILEAMEKTGDGSLDREHLMAGFNALCRAVLLEVARILGMNPVRAVLEEIQTIIGFVKKYHSDSEEKSRIVNDMDAISAELQSGGSQVKKPSKGLFSMFR